jgi:hypothetical protein
MIISDYTAKTKIQENKDYSKIMFLDIKNMESRTDIIKFGWGVELLNQLNLISKANKLHEDFNSVNKMNPSIIHDAINAVLNEKPFNDGQLKEFFALQKEKEAFFDVISKWHDTDHYSTPYEIDYFLLGMPIDKIQEANIAEQLHEDYFAINIDMCFKNMKIEDYIKKAKEIINR